MSESRDIRDPVFNFIGLDGVEADIVSSPAFQRLRGIRQLAFANLVYPGALHTRFEHSLGVCYIAGLMANSLRLSAEDTKLIRLSALLHDIGHGPFSHVSEDILEIYADKKEHTLSGEKRKKIHEIITSEVIRNNRELNIHISWSDRDKIIKILSHGYGDPLLHSIVSGPLDADKQDYLLRDSYFCGVKYGVFDLRQLHRELKFVEDPVEGKFLMVSKDGIHALEQFVLAKYYITNQVYRHRVRLITDQMLIRAITLGIDIDKLEELETIFFYEQTEKYLKHYLDWDDSRFIVTFTDEKFKGKNCHDLLIRLKSRNLLKKIYDKQIKNLPEKCRDPLSNISKPENRKQRAKLEKFLWEPICKAIKDKSVGTLQCEPQNPNFLIVHAYTIKSVREMSKNDEASIPIEKGRGGISTFEEESTLFKSINEKLSQAFVEIYAPVSYESPIERNRLNKILDDVILDKMTIFFGGAENATA